MITVEQLAQMFQALPEPQPVVLKLYYDDAGNPIEYTTETRDGNYIEVDAVEIVKPTVVKITEPHIVQIYEGSVLPRITLTIGFETDPAYLLEQ